jgi:asparagine synthase (glutamine-hydrolysing)
LCGIAGSVTVQAGAELGRLAPTLLRRLEHRGPDDYGWLTLFRESVRLGRGEPGPGPVETLLLHRRLSILDLSTAGWQPMGMPDGRFYLVFNGEIYNYLELRAELELLGHVFRSHSDTEVLLHAFAEWDWQVLPRLVGMFAFAILDVKNRMLFLARDFFGIKPLYYTSSPDRFSFASEIKALLELPGVKRRVNPQRLFEYLRFGRTDHGNGTLFADILQLPAAHFLEVPLDRPGAVRLTRYWSLNRDERIDLSLEEATRRLRDLFLDSVRLHLRSDVAVGAALSGGIDSSAIVTAMRQVEPRLQIHTFSYVAEDPALSEERWVGIAGSRAGAVLHMVQPKPHELVADLDRLIYLQDEPFGSTSIYAQHRVFQLAREAGITVMLDGQGADELLGGYRIYLAARLASLLRQGRWVEAVRFLRRASRLPGTGGLWRVLLQAGGLLLPPAVRALAKRCAGEELMPAWLNARWFHERGVAVLFPPRSGERDILREQLCQTLLETSLPMLLRYEDRNSMAYSIESRVPFLTAPLVSFTLGLPEEYIIAPDGTSKNVFRRAMRGIVPDAVLDRRDKVGFATPEQGWLSTLRPWVEETLSCEAARRIPALDGPGMEREWQAVYQGRRRFDFRLWRWLNLIRWADHFAVSFGD